MGWFVNILYSGQCPPRDNSLEVSLPCTLAPSLPRSIPLPSFLPPDVHASPRPFLACSLHQPSLARPDLPPMTLSACLASSRPPSPCSLPPSLPSPFLPASPCSISPHHPLVPSFPPPSPPSLILFPPSFPTPLAPSLPPSFLPRSLRAPSIPACLPPAVQPNVHRI